MEENALLPGCTKGIVLVSKEFSKREVDKNVNKNLKVQKGRAITIASYE